MCNWRDPGLIQRRPQVLIGRCARKCRPSSAHSRGRGCVGRAGSGRPALSSNVAVAWRMSWNHIAQDAGGPHPHAAIRMRVASDLSVGVAWAGQQPSCEGTPQERLARLGSRSRRARRAFAALAEAVHRGRGHAEPCSHLFDREKRADPNRASDRSPDHGRPKSLGSVGCPWPKLEPTVEPRNARSGLPIVAAPRHAN